jgi:hypothetical protein
MYWLGLGIQAGVKFASVAIGRYPMSGGLKNIDRDIAGVERRISAKNDFITSSLRLHKDTTAEEAQVGEVSTALQNMHGVRRTVGQHFAQVRYRDVGLRGPHEPRTISSRSEPRFLESSIGAKHGGSRLERQ